MIATERSFGERRAGRAASRCHAGPRGFTFLEVILAMAVMLVIASVFLFSYNALSAGRDLGEGALRFESVLRLARAEATQTGRRLRLLVNAEDGGYRIEWEPNPLTEPGAFVDYMESGWAESLPTDLVKVARLDLGPDEWVPSESGGGGAARVNGITFEADGSSESARFVLTSTRQESTEQLIVEIDGVNGVIRTHEPEAEEGAP